MLTEGGAGVGTRFSETRVMFGKEATEEMEVKEFDAPNSYSIGCESCGCRYHTEFRFEPKGEGTDVTVTFEATPISWFAKLTSILFRPMLKMCMKAVVKDLDDIAATLEPPAAAEPTAT